jgi:hypothetical protein
MTTHSPRPVHFTHIVRRLRYPLAAVCVLATATVVAQSGDDTSGLLRRYPFDPACPWGRLSNGKGMVVRCLSEAENGGLARGAAVPPPPPAPVTPPPGAGGAPPVSASPALVAGAAPVLAPEDLAVTIGPVVADQGELSSTRLAQPKSRYAKCVSDFGGMRERSGEVHVRFLVRSRGIAEGVSVAKRVNVSPEAARCIAEIVDRRRVGPPEAPLVGATVVIKFDRTNK